MTHPSRVGPAPSLVDVAAWLDADSRDAFDLLVASVTEMAGFAVAALSVVHRGSDGEVLVTVAAQGADGVRDALVGLAAPVDVVEAELASGEDWGHFRFVPFDRRAASLDDWTWTAPDEVRPRTGVDPGAEDVWDLRDVCMAPLRDAQGATVGLLSIDLPLTGRMPSASHRDLLNRYAAQAERTVRAVLERRDLAVRVRLAETARQVIRLSGNQDSLDTAFDEWRALLAESFGADMVAIRAYAAQGSGELGAPRTGLGGAATPLFREAVHRAWNHREVGVISVLEDSPHLVDDVDRAAVVAQLENLDMGVLMLVPVGVGETCEGHVILGRKDPSYRWTEAECTTLFDIAGDIGQAVRNARVLAREQDLSTYKSELLSTVSHELKNPLGVLSGHLELLDGAGDLSDDAQFSVAAMSRATRRLQRVVDNLLLLSQYDTAEGTADLEPVDLAGLVDDALDLVRFAAQQRNLRIQVDLPDRPVWACGEAAELDRVLTNLLSNAVKYSPRDRVVTVAIADHGEEVELTVTDQGIGISAADRAELFTEFFRSTNPRALAQPGTGLGLAICARIVKRHGGRIEVESELGVGSVFRVVLRAPTP